MRSVFILAPKSSPFFVARHLEAWRERGDVHHLIGFPRNNKNSHCQTFFTAPQREGGEYRGGKLGRADNFRTRKGGDVVLFSFFQRKVWEKIVFPAIERVRKAEKEEPIMQNKQF